MYDEQSSHKYRITPCESSFTFFPSLSSVADKTKLWAVSRANYAEKHETHQRRGGGVERRGEGQGTGGRREVVPVQPLRAPAHRRLRN